MPPAISDDEASTSADEMLDNIPYRGKDQDQILDARNGEEDAEEEGGEDDDEEYVVEKILQHAFDENQVLRYEVKWLGYEKKSDRTWEPEDNLSGAKDLLIEYHQKIGGRPKLTDLSASSRKRKQSGTPTAKQSGAKGRKKTKNGDDESTPTVKKQIKEEKEWAPPAGLWEEAVISVESVEQAVDPKSGDTQLIAYVVWNDERKTQHPVKLLYRKCPQKMLQFYERHLVFKVPQEDVFEEVEEDMKLDA